MRERKKGKDTRIAMSNLKPMLCSVVGTETEHRQGDKQNISLGFGEGKVMTKYRGKKMTAHEKKNVYF